MVARFGTHVWPPSQEVGNALRRAREVTAGSGWSAARCEAEHITAHLIVRRVRRLNPATGARGGQDELFAAHRYHAVFTDSPEPTLNAEAQHRDRAIIEQVIADLKDSALVHLPSGVFTTNAAWLVCAALAYNLTRRAGALAAPSAPAPAPAPSAPT